MRALGRALAVLYLVLAVGLGALLHVAMPLLYRQIGAAQWRIARDTDMDCAPESDAVLLAAADPSVTSYAPAAMLLMGRGPLPRSLWVLSMAPQDHRVEVLDEHSLALSVLGARRRNWWEWVHRAGPIAPGEVFRVRDMTVRVDAVEENGPTRLVVRFERPLGADSLCFAQWRDGALRPLELPAVGQSALLAFEPGPMTR